MDPARKPILEPIVQHIVVSFVVQSQFKPNHDNVCVVHGYFIVNNINVSTSGGLLVDYDSLVFISSLEHITSIIDIFQAL